MAAIAKSGTPSLSSPLPPPNNQTTGLTAGEALDYWDACYVKASDGKVYKSTGAALAQAAEVHGYCPGKHAVGDKNVTLYHGNVNVNYAAGRTDFGAPFYLSGTTAGGLDTAPSTGGLKALGFILDATRLRLYAVQGR
jgi:hypothetical protein